MALLSVLTFAALFVGVVVLLDGALRRRRERRRWITDDAWQQLLRRARGIS